ncbi:hypothetical protein [Ruegeria meonggei]|uniref:Uncharacterized protein n=1 Tax=Ruegeria meonggei TaxID=1446476 RepID=A0A1X6ZHT7_9RHOB|nr:hypothetical protein [Ruegeria meonggei]SLN52093.1 hypothetical protein RUM8411_02515 [Ruegeria meonggei]
MMIRRICINQSELPHVCDGDNETQTSTDTTGLGVVPDFGSLGRPIEEFSP